MTCKSVRKKLPGYLDGALASMVRAGVHEHLELCAECREDLRRYEKLMHVLAQAVPSRPPDDLAVRIRVAVAQARETQGFAARFATWERRAGLVLEHVFKPLALPATGGFVSAMIVFVIVLQLIVPGITVQAVPNDVPINLLRPAELISLSEFPGPWAPETSDTDLAIPHGLLVDVTVDANGEMVNYQILSGPDDPGVRRQLDQLLLFSRFRPMMSFGRPTGGGHVVLSFSEVRVKG
jgi:hypothetical protein